MAKKETNQNYYLKHQKLLNQIIEEHNSNISSPNLFSNSEYAAFNTIRSGVTKFPLRRYQYESLVVMDYLLRCPDNRQEKKELLESIGEKKESGIQIPFMTFQQATGSGKTMLMGASIYFLQQKYDVRNFLIITPASTDIYQKTIRNFQTGTFESVWADDTPFSFNIITGDNYSQNLFYDENKDANIFIFNISKFGSNATNTEKTWESAIWKDENGNSISIKQFLEDKKLIIITDEAHHAQSRVAKGIIHNFKPTAVLEFTATAIEDETKSKKGQQIVYNYDIKQFLEDGHGKLVRAVALASEGKQKKDAEILQSEKLKLITLLLIHILKKKAVLLDPKSRSLKPLSFVKVKTDRKFTTRVFEYLRKEMADDLENINIILDKISAQDLEITELLLEIYRTDFKSDTSQLRREIQKVCDTAIFYHGESDKETEKKFLNIRKNEVEIVVYMQRLDEGIDLPNIYAMAVINDTETDFKTSVKQIIGRGVRLNKDKREFDEEEDKLKANAEMLHIVCDQGKSFQDVILAIQKEFGLNNKYLGFDRKKAPVVNRAKEGLLLNKYIPHIRADLKVRKGVLLRDLVNDTKTIVDKFIEYNCFSGKENKQELFLKYKPDGFFIEVDVFSDEKVFHEQIQNSGGHPELLNIGPAEEKKILQMCLKNLNCLPDTSSTRLAFHNYMEALNKIGIQYYYSSESDENLALNTFISGFSFFYKGHIEKNYFALDFHSINHNEGWNLSKHFRDYEIKIPEDQKEDIRLKVKDRQKFIELIEEQFHFLGYKHSVYDYNKFDSYTEMQMADYADKLIEYQPSGISSEAEAGYENANIAAEPKVIYMKPDGRSIEKTPFWVRNQRNIWFSYGSKKYYPDFILFYNEFIYVIETKGEVFSDSKKNALLARLDLAEGDGIIKGYKGVLIFSSQMDKMDGKLWDFDKFLKEAEDSRRKHQSIADLAQDPPTEKQFIGFIPVYSPDKAFKKFYKSNKTAKPDGWLEVGEIEGGYPITAFACQVKNSALAPTYEFNDWIILNSVDDQSEAGGSLALISHKGIEADGYDGNYTIRQVTIKEKKVKGKLLPEHVLILSALNSTVPSIEIVNPEEKGETIIIAKLFK